MKTIRLFLASVLLLTPMAGLAVADTEMIYGVATEDRLAESNRNEPTYRNYRTVSEAEAERLNQMLRDYPTAAGTNNLYSSDAIGTSEGWTFRYYQQPAYPNDGLSPGADEFNRLLQQNPTAAGNKKLHSRDAIGTAEGWTFRYY